MRIDVSQYVLHLFLVTSVPSVSAHQSGGTTSGDWLSVDAKETVDLWLIFSGTTAPPLQIFFCHGGATHGGLQSESKIHIFPLACGAI